MSDFLGLYNFWIVIFLMMAGFYIVISRENLIKKMIGLNIFQTSVFLLFITMGKVRGGTAPIFRPEDLETMERGGSLADLSQPYTNPIPSVLILTAIVVGVATMSLALALIVRIREEYGTIEGDQILEMEHAE